MALRMNYIQPREIVASIGTLALEVSRMKMIEINTVDGIGL